MVERRRRFTDWRIGGLADWRIGGLADWRIGGLRIEDSVLGLEAKGLMEK
jgi:hypothetical protein